MSAARCSPFERFMVVMELLRDAGESLTLTEIATRAQIDKASTHRILSDAYKHGWVAKLNEGYIPGDQIDRFRLHAIIAIQRKLEQL